MRLKRVFWRAALATWLVFLCSTACPQAIAQKKRAAVLDFEDDTSGSMAASGAFAVDAGAAWQAGVRAAVVGGRHVGAAGGVRAARHAVGRARIRVRRQVGAADRADARNSVEQDAEDGKRVAGAEQPLWYPRLRALSSPTRARDTDPLVVGSRRRATRRQIDRQIEHLGVLGRRWRRGS